MNLKQAHAIAGTLGNPSKMPGYSYGLPAGKAEWIPEYAKKIDDSDAPKAFGCKVGGKLRGIKGTTCASCYAVRGNYLFSNVKRAQYARLKGISDPAWVIAMATLLQHYVKPSQPYFRWHDAGDLLSVEHLAKIVLIANALPWINFWLPTRESGIVSAYLRHRGDIPDNLVIRLSATKIDSSPPSSYDVTSTVHKDTLPVGHLCPAPTQGNNCGECRACWSKDVKNVSYHVH